MERATRTEQLTTRLSVAEMALVERAANAARLTVGAWARQVVLTEAERRLPWKQRDEK
jgi:uncharacterized protein (DUF1778 family)